MSLPRPDSYKYDTFGGLLLPILISNGLSGPGWIPLLRSRGYKFTNTAGNISEHTFLSGQFEETTGVSYQPVAIFGDEFTDEDRMAFCIRKEAERRKYLIPPIELCPLLCNETGETLLNETGAAKLNIMHNLVEGILETDTDGYFLQISKYKEISATIYRVHHGFFANHLYFFLKKI